MGGSGLSCCTCQSDFGPNNVGKTHFVQQDNRFRSWNDDNCKATTAHRHQPNDLPSKIPPRSRTELKEQIQATIYGQCIGDAIGLLTEFMSKPDAHKHYGLISALKCSDKISDRHRNRWHVGDWTDDSDHMILIMQSLTEKKGKVDPKDFAKKLYDWSKKGFKKLHDCGGMGLGRTTYEILSQLSFLSNPEKIAEDTWRNRGGVDAPNGGVMRTSILGIHEWWNVDKVERNAAIICRTTHYDPRCQASAVAVAVAISLMFQRQKQHFDDITGTYKVEKIIFDATERASKYLKDDYEKTELRQCMSYKNLRELELDDEEKMGYTFKCLGAGFWALRQENFQSAIQALVMEGGDADTNCAVAGALLGCKLRSQDNFKKKWISDLTHKEWLDKQIKRYLAVHDEMYSKARQHQASRE